MDWTPRETALCAALGDAYPSREDLEIMLGEGLEKSLEDIATSGPLKSIIFRLVRSAKSEGWLDNLVEAVLADRPDNMLLGMWAHNYRQVALSDPTPPTEQQLLDSVYFSDTDNVRLDDAVVDEASIEVKAQPSEPLAEGVADLETAYQQGIFISYRREETAFPAGWLFDRLVERFGREQVFKDIDTIQPGDDFVERINTAVESCVVLLALIGGRWLTIADQDGQPQLDDPRDYVRLEIEAALARNVRVIPILFDGARMPRAEELPAGLAKLAYRQALELSANRFNDDSQRLLRVLDWAIAEAKEQARRETGPVAEQPRQLPKDRSRPAGHPPIDSTRPTTPREQPYLPTGSPSEPAQPDTGELVREGFLALEREEADEAGHLFLRAIDAGASDGMLGLGILVLNQGNLKEARQWFLRAADAGNSDGMTCLGVLARDRNDTDEAERWFRQAAEAGSADGMAALGMLALDRGDADKAERRFRKAAKAGSADGMAGLGALALDRGDADKAERWFRKAAKAGSADGMAGVGALARDRGDTDEAERWFRQAAEAGSADGMAGLGALARDRGDMDEAEQWIGKAVVASDIDTADRLTSPYIVDPRSAVVHSWESDMDDAPDAMPIDPGYSGHPDAAPTAAVNLGQLLAEQGDVDGARAAYQQAIQSSHGNTASAAAFYLGQLLAGQGDVQGARAAYQQAIDFGHGNAAPMAAFYLGQLLAGQGDVDGAEAAYQQAIDSGHPNAASAAAVNLGRLLAEQGDVQGARNALRQPPDHQSTEEVPADDSALRFVEGSTVRVTREGDRVECSVFAPPMVSPGSTFMIQAFAHISSQTREAMRRAKEFDADAVRRAIKTLEANVPRGTKLSFDLTMPGLRVDDPVQSMVWRGMTESVQFGVTVPRQHRPGNVVGTLTVSQDWIPIGHIKFTLTVTAAPTRSPLPNSAVGETAQRYRVAFISYASEDQTTVLERVQVLPTVGIRTFQDVLNLEPGERWERSLYRHIDESDIILLFWSSAAKRSKWVRKEVRYALDRKHGDEFAPPQIGPVILEGPPVPRPWKELAYLHFNDPRIYIMDR